MRDGNVNFLLQSLPSIPLPRQADFSALPVPFLAPMAMQLPQAGGMASVAQLLGPFFPHAGPGLLPTHQPAGQLAPQPQELPMHARLWQMMEEQRQVRNRQRQQQRARANSPPPEEPQEPPARLLTHIQAMHAPTPAAALPRAFSPPPPLLDTPSPPEPSESPPAGDLLDRLS
jgi:hypothetical protein